jgi:hypothetical protein
MTKKTIHLAIFLFFLTRIYAFNNNNYVVLQATEYGEHVLKISNNSSNNLVNLKILNKFNKVVKEINEFEIGKTPYYSSIDVSALENGDYIIQIVQNNTIISLPVKINK